MIEVRSITAIDDLREAVRLQKEIWGFEDLEILPVRMFVVAKKVGGQTMAAFDGTKMVGFLIAVPGVKRDGTHYLHSNMMGVIAEYRNAGVGRTLKMAQREEALSRDITLIEWTFDPLELKNAYFNIESLGAVIERYVLNQYGVTTSKLHGGLPTDRCIASWRLDRPRGERKPTIERIEISNIASEIRRNDPSAARDIQASVSERFLDYLRRGLVVTGFERGESASAYLFTEQ